MRQTTKKMVKEALKDLLEAVKDKISARQGKRLLTKQEVLPCSDNRRKAERKLRKQLNSAIKALQRWRAEGRNDTRINLGWMHIPQEMQVELQQAGFYIHNDPDNLTWLCLSQ